MTATDAATPQRSRIPLLLALPAFVLLRSGLGYRLMHPARLLFASAFVMVGLPHLINALFYQWPPSSLNTPVLAVFACIVFALGMRHRLLHGRALAAGTSRALTCETGLPLLLSVFPFLPLVFVACVLDPLVCVVAGYLVTFACGPFGWAVLLTGVGLVMVDGRAHAEERRLFLDAADSMVDAERHARRAAHHSQTPQQRPAQPQTAGTPAGAGDDLEWHFARQRD